MAFEYVEVRSAGHVTVVTLNQPDVMNPLHKPAHYELHEVFNAFAADPDQWVAIVTGAGQGIGAAAALASPKLIDRVT